MRFGCCLNMVASNSDGTGIEHIKEVARAGYDYVELPLAEMMQLGNQDFDAIRDSVQNAGLLCEVCNNFFPKTMRLTGEFADPTDVTLAYVERAFVRAKTLGVRKVVFGSGGAKNVPDGFSKSAGYLQVVELLQKIGPIASGYGITIVIEPLRKAECNLINSFEEGCKLADDVNHPNIKVLVDYYHMSVEHELAEHITDYAKGHLAHLHFANPSGRIYPNDSDGHDYTKFIQAVRNTSYDDTLSCEAYSDQFALDAVDALSLLRIKFGKEGFEYEV